MTTPRRHGSTGLPCPSCGGSTKVYDSRMAYAQFAIKRSRECLNCGLRMQTMETYSGKERTATTKRFQIAEVSASTE